MITASHETTGNLHIGRIQDALRRAAGDIDSVVFADDDPVLMRRLAEAMRPENALILPTPQSPSQPGDNGLQDAAVWCIAETAMETLVLAGSSANVVLASEPAPDGSSSTAQPDSPLACLRRAEQKRQQAERHFVDRVESLLAVPEIHSRLLEGSLRFHGLFYRAESGIFSVYNPQDGTFRSLLGRS